MEIKKNEVYTATQVTELLQLNSQTVARLIREKQIKASKIGNRYRVLGADILIFLGANKNG